MTDDLNPQKNISDTLNISNTIGLDRGIKECSTKSDPLDAYSYNGDNFLADGYIKENEELIPYILEQRFCWFFSLRSLEQICQVFIVQKSTKICLFWSLYHLPRMCLVHVNL